MAADWVYDITVEMVEEIDNHQHRMTNINNIN